MTYLSERILTMPDEWQLHLDTLRAKVAGIRRIRRVVGSVWIVFPVPLVAGGYKVWIEFAQQNVFRLLDDLTPYLGLSLGLIVFKHALTLGVRWYLRFKR